MTDTVPAPESVDLRETPVDPHDFTYSVVIPVFNSEAIVADTVNNTLAWFESQGLRHEIVLVDDGSEDGSWSVISGLARRHRAVTALRLLRNRGQHNANLCGFRQSTGDYVITMDDDGQNPPAEIAHLIDEAMLGRDVVFGRFRHKEASRHRALGSRMIGQLNRRIFGQPPDLVVSNFRILRRDVVDRICASNTAFPYITGQALLYSHNRANTDVEHAPRAAGQSNYGMIRILRLILRILFSYSSFPLRFAATVGFVISGLSFIAAIVFIARGIFGDSDVEGWTSIMVLVSFMNGVIILMLSMLGEYVVRTLNQVSAIEPYHVVEVVGDGV